MARAARLALLLLLALVSGCGGDTPAAEERSAPALQRYELGGDFTLTDQNGQPFQLSRLRGKTVLLFFGYTLCPDACPTTLSKLARVYSLLGPAAKDEVVTVFVSVDHGRDKPEKMKEYLEYFDINAVGLSGSKEQIDRIVAQYGARYEFTDSGSAAGYLVNHSTDLYLIDPRGDVRHVFQHKDPPDLLVPVIRQALPART